MLKSIKKRQKEHSAAPFPGSSFPGTAGSALRALVSSSAQLRNRECSGSVKGCDKQYCVGKRKQEPTGFFNL